MCACVSVLGSCLASGSLVDQSLQERKSAASQLISASCASQEVAAVPVQTLQGIQHIIPSPLHSPPLRPLKITPTRTPPPFPPPRLPLPTEDTAGMVQVSVPHQQEDHVCGRANSDGHSADSYHLCGQYHAAVPRQARRHAGAQHSWEQNPAQVSLRFEPCLQHPFLPMCTALCALY